MAMRTLKFTLMAGTALPVQQWQADAAPTPEPVVEDAFGDAFKELTETPPAGDSKDTNAAADAAAAAKLGTEGGVVAEPAVVGDLPDPKVVAAEGAPIEATEAERLAADKAAGKVITAKETGAADDGDKTVEVTKDGITPEMKKAADDALLERFRQIVQQTPQQEPEKKQANPEPVDDYTPEEQGLITAYEKEWPDIYKAEQLIRRKEYQEITGYIFSQLAPVLQQLMGSTQKIAGDAHVQQLQQAVPDYADLRDGVVAWVKEQPAYLKSAYEAVVKAGSVEDVKDLIERYRVAKGIAAPAADAAPAGDGKTPTLRVVEKVDPKSKAALAALTPVKSARSAPVTGEVQKDDFAGAFAAFANAG